MNTYRFSLNSALLPTQPAAQESAAGASKKASLGEENKFFFDKSKGRWVMEGQEELAEPPPPAAPPTSFGTGAATGAMGAAAPGPGVLPGAGVGGGPPGVGGSGPPSTGSGAIPTNLQRGKGGARFCCMLQGKQGLKTQMTGIGTHKVEHALCGLAKPKLLIDCRHGRTGLGPALIVAAGMRNRYVDVFNTSSSGASRAASQSGLDSLVPGRAATRRRAWHATEEKGQGPGCTARAHLRAVAG